MIRKVGMLVSKKLVLGLLFLTVVAQESLHVQPQLSWESLSPQLNAYVSRPFSSFLGKIYHNPHVRHEQSVIFDSMENVDEKYRWLVIIMLKYKSMRQLNALTVPDRSAKIVKDKGYYYVSGEWRQIKENEEDDADDMDDNEPVVEYMSEKELLEQILLDRKFYKGILENIRAWQWNPAKMSCVFRENKN